MGIVVLKNMLGVEVSRPDQKLIIMRGCPGSGKSTLANKLRANGIIHSTDELWEATGDYLAAFKRMNDTGDWSDHGKMHHKNFLNAKKSMKGGLTPVVIDNTNLRPNEARNYVECALKLGFADDNIIIEDVGTGGVTAEELASRNTHGVPLETIQKMIQRHKGNGELTIKKIMDSKGENRRILYSGVVLDEKSREDLIKYIGLNFQEGWTILAHHMTIVFGEGLPENLKGDLGKEVTLRVTHLGRTDLVEACKVEGYFTVNDIPHVTLAVNTEKGGKPIYSKGITEWTPLSSSFNINGVVTEVGI
jgi:NEDD4-binding protein 2